MLIFMDFRVLDPPNQGGGMSEMDNVYEVQMRISWISESARKHLDGCGIATPFAK